MATNMIEISADEIEILKEEIERLMIPLAPHSKSHEDYAGLLREIDSGTVSDGSISTLEHILEITLSTGRIRSAYGPQEEQQLLKLYHRTPTGARLRDHLKQVNRSLEALNDHTVESLSFSLKAPGVYRLNIDTDQCQLTVNIDRYGVSVHQLSVDL